MADGSVDKRVLMISQSTIYGLARHVIDLSESLDARGWDVTVVCPAQGPLPEGITAPGVKLIALEMAREIRPAADLVAFFKLVALCRRLAPPIVHLHSSKAGFLGRVAGRLAGVPVVIFTPNCWSFQSTEGLTRRFYATLEWFASLFADMTIAVSQREVDEAVALGVLRPGAIKVIPNWVTPKREEAPLPAEVQDIVDRARILLVSTGRLWKQKGYPYLLEAMVAVRERESGAQLVVAGEGPMAGELETMARDLGVGETVHFVGKLADVTPLLAKADLFVLSSLWEGLPYSILEAMAAGLPVVATDAGGNAELVQEGVTGHVVPRKDPGALADAVLSILADPDLAHRMGAAGRERTVREFCLEDCVAATEAV